MKNPEAIAWAIAAEGYISLRKNHNSLQPRVGLANTKQDFITKFQTMIGGLGRTYYYKHPNPKHKGKWFWELYSTGDCLEFLVDIYDYLPIKKEQADIVIGFCMRALDRTAKTRNLFRGSPEWKSAWSLTTQDMDDYEEMKKLNSRGVQ